MPRRLGYSSGGEGWEIDLSPFRPLLIQTLTDIFEPKASRQQRERQDAIKTLANLQPTISELPPEEKENFYKMFHSAYGVSQPPFIRKLFGAQAEPILPLPKGGEWVPPELAGVKTKSPTGGRETKVLREGLTEPIATPYTFPMKPLLHEEQGAEIERMGQSLGMSPEEINELKMDITTRKLSPFGVGSTMMANRTIARANKMIQQRMAETGEDEDAATQWLHTVRPDLALLYQEHREEFKGKQAYRKVQEEALEEGTRRKGEELQLKKDTAKRKAEEFNMIMERKDRALDQIDQKMKILNKKIADPAVKARLELLKIQVQDQLRRDLAFNAQQVEAAKNGAIPWESVILKSGSNLFDEFDRNYNEVMYQSQIPQSFSQPGMGGPTAPPPVRESNPVLDIINRVGGGQKGQRRSR